VGFILIMAGRTGWDLLVYMGGFAIDVGLAFALAGPDALGIEGAAVAQACTLTFSAVARLLLVRRFLRIWPFDAAYLRLLPATAVGALVMAGAHVLLPDERWFVDLVASFAAGAAAYAMTLIAVGLTPSERGALLRMARKVLGRSHSAA
jgi:O-antigen/teichoic acid export membrane protein